MDEKLLEEAFLLLENSIGECSYEFEDYLFYMTVYLKNLEDSSIISNYISKIKKAILLIDDSFDEDYLLIKSYEDFDEIFFEKLNFRFLSYAEDLSNILNEFDYVDLSEKMSDLRTKVSLGYELSLIHI